MKGFIEVTEAETKVKVMLAVEMIRSVLYTEGETVWIETGTDRKNEPTGVFVAEGYEEVKQKILESEVLVNGS